MIYMKENIVMNLMFATMQTVPLKVKQIHVFVQNNSVTLLEYSQMS